MNRTPIFLLNGVLSVVLIPVIFVLMFKTDSGRSDSAQLLAALGSKNPSTMVLASALFMALCGCLNGTASSTFSREGGQFWLSKVIPVAPRDQAKGKLLHSFGVAGLGIAAAAVVIAVGFHPPAGELAAGIVIGAVGAFFLTVLGMMIDLARPLLTWTNPQKAIKQNLNVLFSPSSRTWGFSSFFTWSPGIGEGGALGAAVLAAVFGLLAVLAIASYAILLRFADKRYPRIE